MKSLEKLLSGKDLRSIGKCAEVITLIKNQKDFDELFSFLFHPDRIIVMHAADAVEKITSSHPGYLISHKKEVLELFSTARHKELKWHLALIVTRLRLDGKELSKVWSSLTHWAKDRTNSRLVRVGSVQGLFEISKLKPELARDFNLTALEVEKENIPSINARLRNIRKEISTKIRS